MKDTVRFIGPDGSIKDTGSERKPGQATVQLGPQWLTRCSGCETIVSNSLVVDGLCDRCRKGESK